MQAKNEWWLKKIENPGGGDCAFYAFAIGLIDIIKAQAQKNVFTVIDQWEQLCPENKKLRGAILSYNLNVSNRELLFTLQMSLRRILYNRMKDDLQAIAENITADSVFINPLFMDLAHIVSPDTRYQANLNLLSKLKEITTAIQNKRKKMPNFGKSDESLQADVLPLFLTLAFGTERPTKENKLKEDSFILKGLEQLLEPGFWGNHRDLDLLAATFKINLYTYFQGQLGFKSQDVKDLPVIKLNNYSNIHWNTFVYTNEPKPKPIPPKPVLKRPPLQAKQNIELEAKKLKELKEKELKELKVKELKELKEKVRTATKSYVAHSNQNWFSLTQFHGSTGRTRAIDFYQSFMKITDLDKAKMALVEYLYDEANGNRNPYSYRTMLLSRVYSNCADDYDVVSELFDGYLESLADDYKMDLPEKQVTVLDSVYNYLFRS